MKFDIAVATILATEGLSSSGVNAQDATPNLLIRKKITDAVSKTSPTNEQGQEPEGRSLIERLSELATKGQSKKKDTSNGSSNLVNRLLRNEGSAENLGSRGSVPDLGIIASAQKSLRKKAMKLQRLKRIDSDQNDQHRLEEVDLDSIVGYVTGLMNRPLATGITYYCEYLSQANACTSCEVTEVYDEATGEPTGSYNVAVDCQNVPAAYFPTFPDTMTGLELYCSEGVCPECDPLCEICNTDTVNNSVEMQNCGLSEKDMEIIFGNTDVEAVTDAVTSMIEGYDTVTESYAGNPLAMSFMITCTTLNTLGGLYGSTDPCTTCLFGNITDPVTDERTGLYNLYMNCPNIPNELLEGDENVAGGFAELGQACDFNICKTCIIEGYSASLLDCSAAAYTDFIEAKDEEVTESEDSPVEEVEVTTEVEATEETPDDEEEVEVMETPDDSVEDSPIAQDVSSTTDELEVPADEEAGDSAVEEEEETTDVQVEEDPVEESPTEEASETPEEETESVDEEKEKKDNEVDAVEAESGGHSSKATFLTLAFVGISWCWMVA